MVSQQRKYFAKIKRNLPSVARGYLEWHGADWILPGRGIRESWVGGGGGRGNQVGEQRALMVSATPP